MNRREFNKGAVAGALGLLFGKLPVEAEVCPPFKKGFEAEMWWEDPYCDHILDHAAMNDCDNVVQALMYLDTFGYHHGCRMKGIIISLRRQKLWSRLSYKGYPKEPTLFVNARLLTVSSADMVDGDDCILLNSGHDRRGHLLLDPMYVPISVQRQDIATWPIRERRSRLLRRPNIVK